MANPTETTSIVESEPIVEKISDTQIKIAREITTTKVETVERVYTKDFLQGQIEAINAQRATINAELANQLADNEARRIAEIAECAKLLAECEKQGIKTEAEVQAVAVSEAIENAEPIAEAVEGEIIP